MKSVLTLLFIVLTSFAAFAQELPDTPQPQTVQKSSPGFFTFRKGDAKTPFWNAPPLRTNKQVFTSKTFIILHAAYAASVIVDVEYTHGVRESRGSEYPVIPVIIAMDYLMDRFFTRAMSVEAPVWGIQHYIRDAVKGR